MAALSGMKKRTVTINGFSKAYSMTGWRLGYAAAPAEIIDGMNRIQEHSVSCPTSFVQKAGIAALAESQDCVKEMTKEFRKRRNSLIKMLSEIDGVSCVVPGGTFYAFANFSCYEKDSFKFASFLLDDARVAAIPGRAFGKKGEGFIRLSYATSMENIEEGISRIKKAVKAVKS
jgi:aminotransferase